MKMETCRRCGKPTISQEIICESCRSEYDHRDESQEKWKMKEPSKEECWDLTRCQTIADLDKQIDFLQRNLISHKKLKINEELGDSILEASNYPIPTTEDKEGYKFNYQGIELFVAVENKTIDKKHLSDLLNKYRYELEEQMPKLYEELKKLVGE